jgi:hypothetical protein
MVQVFVCMWTPDIIISSLGILVKGSVKGDLLRRGKGKERLMGMNRHITYTFENNNENH